MMLPQRAAFRRLLSQVLLVALAAGACSSGGGGDGDGMVAARFQPSRPNPQAGDVATAQGDTVADMVTVRVTVTDVAGIYSADFRVFWNASRADWVDWTEGPLLGKDGASTSFEVAEIGIGQLRVQATRTGTATAVSAAGTEELVSLDFGIREEGDAPLNLPPASPGFPRALRDATASDLPGLTWWGGLLVGR